MPGDSAAKIKKEYRLLVKKFHPDNFITNLNAMENATEKMKALNEAYSLVKNAPLQKEEDPSDSIKIEYEPAGYNQAGYKQADYNPGQYTANQYDAPYQPPSQWPKYHSFREYFNSTETPEKLYNSAPRRFLVGLLFAVLSPIIILRLMDTLYQVIDDVPVFPQESITTLSPVEYTVLLLIGIISGIYSVLNRDRFFSFWLTVSFCAASIMIPLGLLFAAAIKVLTTLSWSG